MDPPSYCGTTPIYYDASLNPFAKCADANYEYLLPPFQQINGPTFKGVTPLIGGEQP